MSLNAPDETGDLKPLSFIRAIRYMLRDAREDFKAASRIARQRRDHIISREEFSAAMARRFPPRPDAAP